MDKKSLLLTAYMLKIIERKLLSVLTTMLIATGLFFILFSGVKHSFFKKNEILLKASDNNQLNINKLSDFPSIKKSKNDQDENQPRHDLFEQLPADLTNLKLDDSDISNISQTLGLSATSTKTQIERLKELQSGIVPALLKDNPEIAALFNFPPIKDNEIKIDNSKDAGENYLTKVSYYLKNDLPQNPIPPQIILMIKIAQKNPDILPPELKNTPLHDPEIDKLLDIDLYIKSYKKLLSDIKSLAVPKSWINLHKQQILTLQATIASLTAIKNYPDNNFAMILAVQSLNEASSSLNDALKEFKNLLKAQWAPK